jgi:exosortase/archaeosortase family protein
MFNSSQKTVAGRLSFLFAVTVFSVNVIPSQWLAALTGKPSLVPVKIEGIPLITLALLLAGFVLIYRMRLDAVDTGWPKRVQAIAAWIVMGISFLCVFNALHPDHDTLVAIYKQANTVSVFYASLFGGAFYAVLLLPFIAGLFIVFRWSFIRAFLWPFLLIILLTILSIFGLFIEVQYFTFIYKPTMILVGWFLAIAGHSAQISPNFIHITLADFSVNVGPACSGFRFATIFSILYGLLWFSVFKKGGAKHGRLFLMYAGGLLLLFVVNALRIALIVMIGKYYPVFAAALFHNVIGAALFLAMFYVYIKKVVLRFV